MVRTKEEEPELVTVNEVLREAVLLFHSEAVIRNIKLDTDLADSLPPVMISKVQLQQVVINLMMNAAESMLDVSDDRRITIRSSVENGMVQVAVSDFGAGIDEKDLPNIFEPFFTTKRSGLGLGLSLSRSIVERCGGHIWARNNPDKGATFFFNLPAIKSSDQLSSDQSSMNSHK